MEIYSTHKTFTAPPEVRAYLDYLVTIAAYAKTLDVENLYDQAKSVFNEILSQWNTRAQAKAKASKHWYDNLFGTTTEAFVHLPFEQSLEFELSGVERVKSSIARQIGEIGARNQIAMLLKDMLENKEKYIDRKLMTIKIMDFRSFSL